jgi:hypothetical protein
VGTRRSLRWLAGYGAGGNPGVAAAISHISFAIGYIERSYAKGPVLAYAAIRTEPATRLVGVTAGLGVPRTLTWNGSRRTAPEMPTGVATAETAKAAARAAASVQPVPGTWPQ